MSVAYGYWIVFGKKCVKYIRQVRDSVRINTLLDLDVAFNSSLVLQREIEKQNGIMLKFVVVCCCLLVIAHGVTAGWVAPAPLIVKPAPILLPAIATTNIVKAPLIASAPAIGLAEPWGLGLKTLG